MYRTARFKENKKIHILCYVHGTNKMLSKYFAGKGPTIECNGEVTCGSYDSLMFTHGYHYYIAIWKKYGFVPGIICAFISIIYLEIANKSIGFSMGFSLLANWLLICFFYVFFLLHIVLEMNSDAPKYNRRSVVELHKYSLILGCTKNMGNVHMMDRFNLVT